IVPFIAVSPLDNPTDFVVITEGIAGVRQTVGPVPLPSTGLYLIIIADLQEDASERNSFGDYAFLLSDLTFGTSFRALAYDEQTNSIVLEEPLQLVFASSTEAPTAVCPNISLAC